MRGREKPLIIVTNRFGWGGLYPFARCFPNMERFYFFVLLRLRTDPIN